MSDIKNDGGPAFPAPYDLHHTHTGQPTGDSGMSLRDWFAGMALHGLLADGKLTPAARQHGEHGAIASISGVAFQFADAMLKARGQ